MDHFKHNALVLASRQLVPEKAPRPQIASIPLVASLCAVMIGISVRGIFQRLSLVKTSSLRLCLTLHFPPNFPPFFSLFLPLHLDSLFKRRWEIVLVLYAHGSDLDFNFQFLTPFF